MFQLTENDCKNLNRSQVVTGSDNKKHSSTLPYVFTEQGVAMLATILRTDVATEISIRIMDAFVYMKRYISTNLIEQKYVNNQVLKNTEDIKLLQESFNKLAKKEINHHIFLKGKYTMHIRY